MDELQERVYGNVILSTGEIEFPIDSLRKLRSYRTCEEFKLLRPENDCIFDLSETDPETADLFLRILDGRIPGNMHGKEQELFELFDTYTLDDTEILTQFPSPDSEQVEGWFSKHLYDLYQKGNLVVESERLMKHLALEFLLHGSYQLHEHLPSTILALMQDPWAFYPDPEIYLEIAYPAPAKERFPIFGERLQIRQELRNHGPRIVEDALKEGLNPDNIQDWLPEKLWAFDDDEVYHLNSRIFTHPLKIYSESGRLPIPINVWVGLALQNPESEKIRNFLEQYYQNQVLDKARGVENWDPLPESFLMLEHNERAGRGHDEQAEGRRNYLQIRIPFGLKLSTVEFLNFGIVPEIEKINIENYSGRAKQRFILEAMAKNRVDVVETLLNGDPDFEKELKHTFKIRYWGTSIKPQTFKDGEIWVLRALRQSTPMLKLFLDRGFQPNFRARYLSQFSDEISTTTFIPYDRGFARVVLDLENDDSNTYVGAGEYPKYRYLFPLAVERSPESTRLLLASKGFLLPEEVEEVEEDDSEDSDDDEGDAERIRKKLEEDLPLSFYILENSLYDIVPLVRILQDAKVLSLGPDEEFYSRLLKRLDSDEVGIPEDYLELLKALTPEVVEQEKNEGLSEYERYRLKSKSRQNPLFSLMRIFEDDGEPVFGDPHEMGSLMRDLVLSDRNNEDRPKPGILSIPSYQTRSFPNYDPLTPLEKKSQERLMDFFEYSLDRLIEAGYDPLELLNDGDIWPPPPERQISLLQMPAAYRIPQVFEILVKRVPELLSFNERGLVETYMRKSTQKGLEMLFKAKPDLRRMIPLSYITGLESGPATMDWETDDEHEPNEEVYE